MHLLLLALWTITLAWAAPTLNTDGTPVNDLAGFRVYEAPAEDMVDAVIVSTVTNGVVNAPSWDTSYSVSVTPASNGVWYAVKSFDFSGQESDYSDPLEFTDARPGKTSVQITVMTNQ